MSNQDEQLLLMAKRVTLWIKGCMVFGGFILTGFSILCILLPDPNHTVSLVFVGLAFALVAVGKSAKPII